ncbi:MAG: ATP phosphoribosyltransferase regulatory subunit [Pseudomonadota bacterium]
MTEVTARAAALRARFEAAGARPVETSILQDADVLLDLYGEDIRARAYVTSDALRGEQMLRPDFTVPVVHMHMDGGAEPARYTYSGKVFRRQEEDEDRANEYTQVGYEVFDRARPEEADAEVFSLIRMTLGTAPVRAATGDIGLLTAAVHGLETSQARKSALLRHIWRPRKFRALLDRYAGGGQAVAGRAELLQAEDPFAQAGPAIGLRSPSDVRARLAALREDAQTAPLTAQAVELFDALLSVREAMPFAIEQLRDISIDMPSIAPSVDRLVRRMAALRARGVNVETLEFEASYGRTQMEYYDGFVFGFYAETRADLPPIATGGRYDALTRQLGQGAEIPAVGGVVRPDLLLQLEGAP